MNKVSKNTGIILAAGLGSRLCNNDTKYKSKPLAKIDDIALVIRTLKSHEVAGCEKVIVVLGWQAEKIKHDIISKYKGPIDLQFVYNEHYKLNNGISVLCAKPFIEEKFILTMADHILDDRIMRLASDNIPPKNGATLCVDFKLNTIFDIDDATKVFEENGFIRSIGKNLKEYNCIDTGVFIGTNGLMEAIETIFNKNGNVSLSEGVQILCEKRKMAILDIKNSFWQDVDTPEMLEHAEKILKSKINNLHIHFD